MPSSTCYIFMPWFEIFKSIIYILTVNSVNKYNGSSTKIQINSNSNMYFEKHNYKLHTQKFLTIYRLATLDCGQRLLIVPNNRHQVIKFHVTQTMGPQIYI